MKNNPLAIICIFFCLGIWVAKLVHIPLFFLFASCGLFLITALVSLEKKFLFSVSLSIAIFLTGFLHFSNTQTYPANHISHFVSDDAQSVYLTGKIISNPEVSSTFYGSDKKVFTFQAHDLKIKEQWQAIEGLLRVTLYGQREVQHGDQLLLQGSLEQPPGLRNPGGFDYRAYLVNHNIMALLKVKEKDAFLGLASPGGLGTPLDISSSVASSPSAPRNDGFFRALFRFKQKLHNIIYRHLEGEQAALLSAILLGERTNLSQDVKDLFIKTGTIHILAISGLHIGLISLILLAVFRFLRLQRSLGFIFTILILIAYAFLSGLRPSVVRATIMAVIVLFGFLLNREVKIYNSLGLAALLILLVHPHYLFDAGFQLSFVSVISIVYFVPRIEKLFPAAQNRYLSYLIRAGSVSLAAWIGVAPLVAYYFNIVTPVAVVANLLIVPCLFLVVSAGICFLFFALIWAPLGAIFAQTSALSLLGLSKLASLIGQIPFGFFASAPPSVFLFCGYYSGLILIFNYRKLDIAPAKIAIALAVIANIIVWRPLFEASSDKLTVTFLDVGHGDAIFIQFPRKGAMLIDGGPASDENDAGKAVILPFLRNRGINKVDAVLLTHPDNDHVGGLPSVIKNVEVDYAFDNGMPEESLIYASYKRQLVKNVPHYRILKQGDEILGFPQVKLSVLYPARPFLVGSGADNNNNSLVIRLVYRDVSFLFCGDIQRQAIQRILAYAPLLQSTVIKVPHHGSYEGKTEDEFFRAASAQVAVISVGRNSRFGFPRPQVIRELKQVDTQVYQTSENGAVIISTDGEDVEVETMVGAEAGT